MLDSLRRGASSWLAKGLLGLLVLSFAVWGIADVFTGYGRGSIATVGSETIPAEQFQQVYATQLDAISRQFGRRLTNEQAQAFGLPAQVLSQMVGAAAVDSHAKELGLAISEKGLIDDIQSDPMFKDGTGSFSKPQLDSVLRQAGVSEPRFLQDRRKDVVREQLTETLMGAVALPETMVTSLHTYRNATRVAKLFQVPAAKVVKLDAPSEETLRSFYEERKAEFKTPEYRHIKALLMTSTAVQAKIEIAEADLRASYEATKASYDVAEKRRLQQIAFKDRAAADAGKQALAAGKSFIDVAKEAGAKESDIELGLLAQSQMIDRAIAEAAFKLKTDEVSGVIEGNFATVIVRATEIVEGKQSTFEDVRDKVRAALAEGRAAEEIQRLHDEVDNAKLAGKSLEEIATAFKVPFIDVTAVDRAGRTPDGKPAIEGEAAEAVVAAGFAGAVGVESTPVELADGGYAWVDVIAVTPEAQRAFEEAKADVKAAWERRETESALRAATQKMVERIGKGEAIEAIAKEIGSAVSTTPAFKRTDSPQGLSRAGVQQAFTLTKGAATSADAEGVEAATRVVFVVTEATAPGEPTKDERVALERELKRQMQSDLLAEYVGGLQQRLGVAINQDAVNQMLGLAQPR